MRLDARIVFVSLAFALAACSGDFGTGTGMPQSNPIPPMGQGTPVPGGMGPNGLPQNQSQYTPEPSTSAQPGGASFPMSEASTTGFTCPQTSANFACMLKFNLPPPTPAPSPNAKGQKPTPTPSPTPTPTPTPDQSDDNAPDTPTPSPSPTPVSVLLRAEANPKDAPQMMHLPENTLDVVPLMMVSVTPGGDFKLAGYAQAQFTIPKEETSGRGFALQLFQEVESHKKTTYNPLWTLNKSVLQDSTLTFTFNMKPGLTIPKGSTYALVLYADDLAKASPSPHASSSASPSPSPSPSTSPSAAPTATPSPSTN